MVTKQSTLKFTVGRNIHTHKHTGFCVECILGKLLVETQLYFSRWLCSLVLNHLLNNLSFPHWYKMTVIFLKLGFHTRYFPNKLNLAHSPHPQYCKALLYLWSYFFPLQFQPETHLGDSCHHGISLALPHYILQRKILEVLVSRVMTQSLEGL